MLIQLTINELCFHTIGALNVGNNYEIIEKKDQKGPLIPKIIWIK